MSVDARPTCWSTKADLYRRLGGNKGYLLVEFGVVQHGWRRLFHG